MADVGSGGAAGAETSGIGASAAPERVQRMTAGRKRDAVLRPGGRTAPGFTAHSGQQKDEVVPALEAAGFIEPRLLDVEGGFCAWPRSTELIGAGGGVPAHTGVWSRGGAGRR